MDILIVEDDVLTAKVITQSIMDWGHIVEYVRTGEDSLRKVREKRFDLVLLDIFLPDCMGHDLIPQFKEMWHDIGIVTMTGYNTRDLELKARRYGIIYYMIKPFNMKEMKEILDHLSKKRIRERR